MKHIKRELLSKSELDISQNFGSLKGCNKCSGFLCCSILKKGGHIEPPFLSKNDIENIKYFTGLSEDKFIEKRENPITGNIINLIRTSPDNGCIFFNQNSGRCSIYHFRPLDCRFFPLDILFDKNKYFWALFKFHRCKVQKEYLSNHLHYANKALIYSKEEIHDYATFPTPGMDKIGYKILNKINLAL